jgi:hypothetical protein
MNPPIGKNRIISSNQHRLTISDQSKFRPLLTNRNAGKSNDNFNKISNFNMTNTVSKHQAPESSLGEQIFLFVWAFLSSGKEFLVDAVADLLDHYQNGSQGKTKRLKNKQLYFARLKRQMGIIDEDVPSDATKETPGQSLEDELMFLKSQMSNLQKQSSVPPPPPTPTVKLPTPPPLTDLSSPRKQDITSPRKEHPKVQERGLDFKRSQSLPQQIQNGTVFEEMKRVQLRSVKPEDRKVYSKKDEQAIFQNSLFAAIQNKFKLANREEDSPVATPENKKRSFGASPKAKELVASQDETMKACENLKNLLDIVGENTSKNVQATHKRIQTNV